MADNFAYFTALEESKIEAEKAKEDSKQQKMKAEYLRGKTMPKETIYQITKWYKSVFLL